MAWYKHKLSSIIDVYPYVYVLGCFRENSMPISS